MHTDFDEMQIRDWSALFDSFDEKQSRIYSKRSSLVNLSIVARSFGTVEFFQVALNGVCDQYEFFKHSKL